MGRPVGGVGHAHRRQGVGDPDGQSTARQAQVGGPEGHVAVHGGQEELVVGVLEHDAHPPTYLTQVGLLHRQALDDDAPRTGLQDPVAVQHEGRLARPVGAQHRHPLPRCHPQIDAAQGDPSVGVGVVHAVELERRRLPGARGHVTTATAAVASASSGMVAAGHHTGARSGAADVTGKRPVKPRAAMARCTRSPRS